jgi:hypothetical protein
MRLFGLGSDIPSLLFSLDLVSHKDRTEYHSSSERIERIESIAHDFHIGLDLRSAPTP